MDRVKRRKARPKAGSGHSSRLAVSIVPLIAFDCCGVTIITYTALSAHVAADQLAGGLTMVAALITLQWVRWIIGASRLGRWQRTAILAAEAVFTFSAALFFQLAWMGIGGFLAGSVLLLTEFPLSCFLVLGAAACSAATAMRFPVIGTGPGGAIRQAAITTLAGLLLFGLDRLGGHLRKSQRATGNAVAVEVARERQRFARDLHDLLGFSLSAITVKSELAHRLVDIQPTLARQELEAVVRVSRQVLADVQTLAQGYRTMPLDRELDTIVAMLEGTGRAVTLDVSAEITVAAIPPETSMVLTAVLREGAANIVRHSTGRRCCIEVSRLGRRISLTLSNDGAAGSVAPGLGAGSGLDNLAWRMNAIGGSFDVVRSGDWFVLNARTPPVEAAGFNTASPLPAPPEPRPSGYAR